MVRQALWLHEVALEGIKDYLATNVSVSNSEKSDVVENGAPANAVAAGAAAAATTSDDKDKSKKIKKSKAKAKTKTVSEAKAEVGVSKSSELGADDGLAWYDSNHEKAAAIISRLMEDDSSQMGVTLAEVARKWKGARHIRKHTARAAVAALTGKSPSSRLSLEDVIYTLLAATDSKTGGVVASSLTPSPGPHAVSGTSTEGASLDSTSGAQATHNPREASHHGEATVEGAPGAQEVAVEDGARIADINADEREAIGAITTYEGEEEEQEEEEDISERTADQGMNGSDDIDMMQYLKSRSRW